MFLSDDYTTSTLQDVCVCMSQPPDTYSNYRLHTSVMTKMPFSLNGMFSWCIFEQGFAVFFPDAYLQTHHMLQFWVVHSPPLEFVTISKSSTNETDRKMFGFFNISHCSQWGCCPLVLLHINFVVLNNSVDLCHYSVNWCLLLARILVNRFTTKNEL